MSPGATMERVYLDLKARVLAGEFAPGARLDPLLLSRSLSASATPVRDALNRLSGERLVESWHQEGFRQPQLAEGDISDLYIWAGSLLSLALKGRTPMPESPDGLIELATHDRYSEGIDRLFRTIAIGSSHRELRYAIVNVIERTAAIRETEAAVDERAAHALAAMSEDYRFGRWSSLRNKITQFHRRRVAFASRVAARVRPRSQPLR
ncbi:MAG: GntR family transcriptional regulator [Sphingopyxis sp.]|uniref:GntR family transcriptional regulator n=1 Tax=Sphingopyxis sp. TaxID=1908224 RepID=UPI002ABC4978|nr:GntR family transcriptional regulator [Sphingopyxis sp.]MDZ3831952.1 GntR family transcriptional regulator [Sphingopyxis sp.]